MRHMTFEIAIGNVSEIAHNNLRILNVKLDFKEAAALDLAGDKMLEVAKNIAKRQVLERHH